MAANPVPIFVAVALRLDEAEALFNAARATLGALSQISRVAEHGRELSGGMLTLAEAIDKARGAREES